MLARLVAALALIGAWTFVAAPAHASSLDGCSGSAESLDADGSSLDQATAADGEITDPETGKATATASDPFVVDNDGVVRYSGQTDNVITDHTWKVTMLGVTVLSGGSENASRTQEDSGEVDLGDELPFKFTGLIKVEGDLTGTGGSCSGDGFIKVQGSPFASPITWAGLIFAGVGALGVFLSLPRAVPNKGA
jgi:hypothetical protein